MEEAVDAPRTGEAKRCRCGHELGHYWIRPSYKFGPLGVIGFGIGVRVTPRQVDYECGVCGEVIKSVTNPDVLRLFKNREPPISVVRDSD